MSYHGIVKQGKKLGNRKTHDMLHPLVISKGSMMTEECSFVRSRVLCFNFRNNISTKTMITGFVHKFAVLILGNSNVVLACNPTKMFAWVSPDHLRNIWGWSMLVHRSSTNWYIASWTSWALSTASAFTRTLWELCLRQAGTWLPPCTIWS